MAYRLFKKTVKSKSGKESKKWYYRYYDPTGIQIKKACRGCKTKNEAEA
ncbi:Arm DNA-binding domain-containing protein [Treponema sp. OMZ 840]